MLFSFQKDGFKINGALARVIRSPAWFAVGAGLLARELTKAFTPSQVAAWAVFIVVGYVVWSLVNDRVKTLEIHSTETTSLKHKIDLLEKHLEETELEAAIDRSKKHNLATYSRGTCEADVEFFKSLLREQDLSDELRAAIIERKEANKELVAFIKNEIPSDKIAHRLFGAKEIKKR